MSKFIPKSKVEADKVRQKSMQDLIKDRLELDLVEYQGIWLTRKTYNLLMKLEAEWKEQRNET